MVDRVYNKYGETQLYRVDATRDSLEEEKGKENPEEGEGEGKPSEFANIKKKDWQQLVDKNHLWKRNLTLKTEEVRAVKILGLNLKSDPSLIKLRIFLNDGREINTAFMSLERSRALKLQTGHESSVTDLKLLTSDQILRVTIPQDEQRVDDEITRVTKPEVTLSETIKSLVARRSLLSALGVVDLKTNQVNKEILGIYITAAAVLTVIVFALFLLIL